MPHDRVRCHVLFLVLVSFFAAISASFSHEEPAVHRHRHRQLAASNTSAVSDRQPTTTRYGQASVYLASERIVLFIGGQVGPSATVVTNDVFAISLDNATSSPPLGEVVPRLDLTAGLPPQAWAAVAVDATERIWTIGGVTQDCTRDSLVYTLNVSATTTAISSSTSSWTPLPDTSSASITTNTLPPRRRQAAAVAVKDGDEIWVFGGIAGPYTCSFDTAAYAGMDRWTTADGSVQSLGWDQDVFRQLGVSPPSSDYAAVALDDGVRVVFVGGQASDGSLVNMTSLLVFDTQTESWSVEVRKYYHTGLSLLDLN
jgi:hypothetical protein